MNTSAHAVEFVGGPLDGHIQSFSHAPERLPRRTVLPLNPSLLAFLAGQAPQDRVRGPATSRAVYRLERDGGLLRYLHVGSLTASERRCRV